LVFHLKEFILIESLITDKIYRFVNFLTFQSSIENRTATIKKCLKKIRIVWFQYLKNLQVKGGYMTKKILSIALVIALAFSLTVLAGEEDFEGGTIGDWEIWDYCGHERHADLMGRGATMEITGDMNYEVGGSNALRVVLTDPSDTGWVEPQFTNEGEFL
jgi:hypothetical protein